MLPNSALPDADRRDTGPVVSPLPAAMTAALGDLLQRSGLRHVQGAVDDDFMRVLSKADGKKAGNPEFDPSLHDLSAADSFWLGCRDRNGDLVATVASRLLDARGFLESCRTYQLWYGDKIRFTEPLDIVLDRYDRLPSGATAFMGAAWVRPDWRGHGLSWALTRLGYFTAIRQWDLDWVAAMVFAGIAQAMMPGVNYGFPRSDLFATGYRVPGFSRQNLFLLSMTLYEALTLAADDLRFLIGNPGLLLDPGFGDQLRARRRSDPVANEAAQGVPVVSLAS